MPRPTKEEILRKNQELERIAAIQERKEAWLKAQYSPTQKRSQSASGALSAQGRQPSDFVPRYRDCHITNAAGPARLPNVGWDFTQQMPTQFQPRTSEPDCRMRSSESASASASASSSTISPVLPYDRLSDRLGDRPDDSLFDDQVTQLAMAASLFDHEQKHNMSLCGLLPVFPTDRWSDKRDAKRDAKRDDKGDDNRDDKQFDHDTRLAMAASLYNYTQPVESQPKQLHDVHLEQARQFEELYRCINTQDNHIKEQARHIEEQARHIEELYQCMREQEATIKALKREQHMLHNYMPRDYKF